MIQAVNHNPTLQHLTEIRLDSPTPNHSTWSYIISITLQQAQSLLAQRAITLLAPIPDIAVVMDFPQPQS